MEHLGFHCTDFHDILYLFRVKGKGKVHAITGHEGPEGVEV
jgi:hypothetical protein